LGTAGPCIRLHQGRGRAGREREVLIASSPGRGSIEPWKGTAWIRTTTDDYLKEGGIGGGVTGSEDQSVVEASAGWAYEVEGGLRLDGWDGDHDHSLRGRGSASGCRNHDKRSPAPAGSTGRYMPRYHDTENRKLQCCSVRACVFPRRRDGTSGAGSCRSVRDGAPSMGAVIVMKLFFGKK